MKWKVLLAAIACIAISVSAFVVLNPGRHPPALVTNHTPTWHIIADKSGSAPAIAPAENLTFHLLGEKNYLNWTFLTSESNYATFVIHLYFPNNTTTNLVCLLGNETAGSPYVPSPSSSCQTIQCDTPNCARLNTYSGQAMLNFPQGSYALNPVSNTGDWRVAIADYY